MRLILLCTLLGSYTCALAHEGEKQATYYVYADTVAFYDKPDANATPVGYYYFRDSLVGLMPIGLSVTLPLLSPHQFDQEYWGGEMDPQSNSLTGEWFEKNVNGNHVYIPVQGVSTIPMPPFGDDAGYLTFQGRVKQWLNDYAGESTDSLHTLLPKMPEGDVNEKYELKYTNHVELSVEDEYDTYGIGSTVIGLYLPDVKLTEAYWLAIRLYLGVQYAEVKWIGVNTTDHTVGVTSFSEGQTLEITANEEKGGIRLTWLYGGC